MIVLEYLEASFRLRAMVLTLRAPAHHGLFVAPGRQRKQATFRPFAFEPLVVDEAVHGLELRLEKFRKVEIVVPAFLLGLDREDYGKHGLLLLLRTHGNDRFATAPVEECNARPYSAWRIVSSAGCVPLHTEALTWQMVHRPPFVRPDRYGRIRSVHR
jgi:hypothetical protein